MNNDNNDYYNHSEAENINNINNDEYNDSNSNNTKARIFFNRIREKNV